MTALRLCMEVLMPARRQRVLQFKLPALKTLADVALACETVVKGVARGRLTPAEGHAFTIMLDARRHMIETEELDARLCALEERQDRPTRNRLRPLPSGSEDGDD